MTDTSSAIAAYDAGTTGPPAAVGDAHLDLTLQTARKVADQARRGSRLAEATVQAVESGKVLITYAPADAGWGTGSQSVDHLASYTPQVGDIVLVAATPNGPVVLGTRALRTTETNPEPWTQISVADAPGFTNGWTNYGSGFLPAAFWKDPDGFVHLRGVVAGGTVGASAWTLPIGYRPSTIETVPVHNSAAVGRCDISPDGTIVPAVIGSNVYVGLDGISFQASVDVLGPGRTLGYDQPDAGWRALPANYTEGLLDWSFQAFSSGDGWGPPAYHVNRWGMVRLRGLFEPLGGCLGQLLAQLPESTLGLGRDYMLGFDANGNGGVGGAYSLSPGFDIGKLVCWPSGPRAYLSVSGARWFNQTSYADWTEFPLSAFANGWSPYGESNGAVRMARPAYWKDPFGVVHLRGAITGGSIAGGGTVLVLPVGYRPSAVATDRTMHAVESPSGATRLDVYGSGVVAFTGAGNVRVSLAGISFRAAG